MGKSSSTVLEERVDYVKSVSTPTRQRQRKMTCSLMELWPRSPASRLSPVRSPLYLLRGCRGFNSMRSRKRGHILKEKLRSMMTKVKLPPRAHLFISLTDEKADPDLKDAELRTNFA